MKTKTYRNGWSTMMNKGAYMYEVNVRDARGDIHDKMRCDDYQTACQYYRAFNAIAKAA
jgi:hypothetical protein